MSSKGGGDEKLSNAPSSVQLPTPGLVIHPDHTTDEGYTRLQVVYFVLAFLPASSLNLTFFRRLEGRAALQEGAWQT